MTPAETETKEIHMNATETLKPAIRHAGHTMTEAEARAKMDSYIESCRSRSVKTMETIRDVVPTDRIIPARALGFSIAGRNETNAGTLEYIAPAPRGSNAAPVRETFHRNALSQLSGRLSIPLAYVDHLQQQGDWGMDLLAKSMVEHTSHSNDRFLVRSVGGQARGVLSDKFKRLDVRPGALALLDAARTRGMVVSDGIATDTRTSLKFILPQTLEVFPGEWMVFGFDWSNSDYGRGASDLRMFFWRAWCWNGAVGESVVRQIHIGRRIGDEEDIEYTAETLAAEAHANALKLRDAAATAMSEVKLNRMIEGIRAANETKIDGKAKAEQLKKQLNKGEVESVVEAFNSPDVENMPAGNTLWRWSNAISWVGGKQEDADKKIDFERIAGEVLKPAMPKEAAPAPVAA